MSFFWFLVMVGCGQDAEKEAPASALPAEPEAGARAAAEAPANAGPSDSALRSRLSPEQQEEEARRALELQVLGTAGSDDGKQLHILGDQAASSGALDEALAGVSGAGVTTGRADHRDDGLMGATGTQFGETFGRGGGHADAAYGGGTRDGLFGAAGAERSAEPLPAGLGGRGHKGEATVAQGAKADRQGTAAPAAPTVPAGSGDQYARHVETGFVDPAVQPLSTFAADVDTASYSNTRRYLREGTLPPAGAVRVEEMVNAFAYDYAAPTGAPIATYTELTTAPWARDRLLLRIGVKAREVPAHEPVARNLVFLVDVSGSMANDDKLPLVRRALTSLAYALGPHDHVAIVTYAGHAGVALPPTSGADAYRVLAAIDDLTAGGSTAGAEGIRTAYALAREHFDTGAVNRVILATDGDFNVGVSDDASLVRLIEEERESGVYLSVLGVGRGNLQDAKMEALADHGNGTYAYLDSDLEARRVLVDGLNGSLVTVAKDVKLQVEFNPANVGGYRLVGYEDRRLADRDFNDDRKDAGDVGAGHAVTALYELIPAEGAAGVDMLRYQASSPSAAGAHSDELATIKVRYKSPEGGASQKLSFLVRTAVTPFKEARVDTRWAATVAGFGLLLTGSRSVDGYDWADVRSAARAAVGADPRGERKEFLELVDRAEALSDRG